MNKIKRLIASNYLTFMISALACMGSYGALHLIPSAPQVEQVFGIFKACLLSAIFISFCFFFIGLAINNQNAGRDTYERQKTIS